MRRPYRILLWSTSGLVAACIVLLVTALLAMPRPTPAELTRDATVPTPPSGPGHGWYYASDGTRLYERVYKTESPRRGIVLYIAGITGLGGDEQPEFVAAMVGRGLEVRVLHPRGTGFSDGARRHRGSRSLRRGLPGVSTRGRAGGNAARTYRAQHGRRVRVACRCAPAADGGTGAHQPDASLRRESGFVAHRPAVRGLCRLHGVRAGRARGGHERAAGRHHTPRGPRRGHPSA